MNETWCFLLFVITNKIRRKHCLIIIVQYPTRKEIRTLDRDCTTEQVGKCILKMWEILAINIFTYGSKMRVKERERGRKTTDLVRWRGDGVPLMEVPRQVGRVGLRRPYAIWEPWPPPASTSPRPQTHASPATHIKWCWHNRLPRLTWALSQTVCEWCRYITTVTLSLTSSMLSLTEISWKAWQPMSRLLLMPSSLLTILSPVWSFLFPTSTTGTSHDASCNKYIELESNINTR